jgi:hypothetical protein
MPIRFSSSLLWSFAASSAIILLLSLDQIPSTAAVDLHPLKNLMKDDNGRSKDNSIARSFVDDAATGTITTVEPGKERAPVSCNEIMAQAVVVASEEKEAALRERNDALAQATQAVAKSDEISLLIKGALAEAKTATIEYEALKLMSDRLVEEARNTADTKVRTMKTETDAKLTSTIDEYDVKIENTQKETEAKLTNTVEAYEAHIQNMNKEANTKMENTVAAFDAKEKSLLEQIEETKKDITEDMQKKIDFVELQFQNYKVSAEEEMAKASQGMIALKETASDEVDAVKDEMETLKKNLEEEIKKVNDERDAQIKRTHKEAGEAIELATQDGMERVMEAEERAAKIELKAEKEVEATYVKCEATVNDVHRKARMEYERIQTEADQAMNELKEKHHKLVETKELNFNNHRQKAIAKESEMASTINNQSGEISSLKQSIEELEQSLERETKEMEFFKSLHDQKLYVNTTLVVEDSKAYMDATIVYTKKKVNALSDTVHKETEIQFRALYSKMDVVSKPYRFKIAELYDAHLKEIVDDSITPFYINRVAPVQTKVYDQVHKELSPLLEKMDIEIRLKCEELLIFSRVSFEQYCNVAHDKISQLKESLAHSGNVPKYIISALEVIESDTSTFILLAIKIVCFLMILKLRFLILRLIATFLMLPFRVIWFFCPLRFIIQKSPKKTKKTKGNKKSKAVHKKVVNNKKIVKEEQ